MRCPQIQLTGVCKDYALGDTPVPALRDIDLAIGPGEFVAIMGPSGSGKSTLLNLLGLLDRPGAGQYFFEGKEVAGLDADRRAELRNTGVGFVFQNFNLLPRNSAVENVELPLVYRGLPARERRHLAQAALEVVGLSHRLHHSPQQLSGGEQQRVAIARSIVNGPSLLLADEPTGALDSKSGRAVMELIGLLNEDGMTTVLVTHDLTVARAARRIVSIHDGRIVDDRWRDSAPQGLGVHGAAASSLDLSTSAGRSGSSKYDL